jgi:hypothetical protein
MRREERIYQWVEHYNDGLQESGRVIPSMHINLNVKTEELRRDNT